MTDKEQKIHDFSLAAATLSTYLNKDAEIFNFSKEEQPEAIAGCIKTEYDRYHALFSKRDL